MREAMPLLQNSLSNHLSLETALARLAANDLVEGLALFGSRAGGAALPASDYDLLILISTLPVGIFQMLSHIDGRMTDIVFVLTADADRLLAGAGPVAANTNDGRFLLKMQTAQIVYDAAGRLARVQTLARRGGWLAPSRPADKYGAWFWHNFGLYQLKRMAQAGDPLYDTTVDLMLCGGLSDICRAYYQIRDLPWEGEKAALRYLQQHDAQYLARLRECLAASDRARKVELFEQIVADTLRPAGETWQPGCTAVCLDGPDQARVQVETALDFWQSFFNKLAL
jgi:predicted nucleotidyltransferase